MMKIKCAKCKIVEELKEEDITLLAHIVKKYNQSASPADYIGILSIIKGNCTDKGKHVFTFEESFEKEVADTLKEYNNAISANVQRKENLDKMGKSIFEIKEEIKNLQNELKELDTNKELTIAEMNAGGILIENIKIKFVKLTGTDDMEMWS